MKGLEGSWVFVGENGFPLLPLVQTKNSVGIAGYDYMYHTSSETKMIFLLKKFEVMESRVVIEQWKEGGDSLNENQSKRYIFWCFYKSTRATC